MSYRVRIFLDYWNFSLKWRDMIGPRAHYDIARLPREVVQAAQAVLQSASDSTALNLQETRIYTSFDPQTEAGRKHREWCDNFLDMLPGVRVFHRERRTRPRPLHCRSCGQTFANCPQCKQPLHHSPEKGVDTAIVTDMLALAWEDAYDVGVLISSDADFIPGVELVQSKGYKIINGMWLNFGADLARTCWGNFKLNALVPTITKAQ